MALHWLRGFLVTRVCEPQNLETTQCHCQSHGSHHLWPWVETLQICWKELGLLTPWHLAGHFQINCQVQNFQKFSRYLKSRLISLDKKTKAILTPKWLLGTWKVWWEFSPSNNIQLMPKDSTCWCGGLHDSKKLVKESQGPQHANNVFYLLIISYVFQGPLLRWSL